MLGPKALAIIAGLVAQNPAVDTAELECMSMALYHEARNQPDSGQVAVAQVILNRVASKRFPDTVCGVVKENRRPGKLHACQFSFYCDGKDDRPTDWEAIKRAIFIAYDTMRGDLDAGVGDSTHYFAPALISKPHKWMRKFETVAVVYGHQFMRPPK